jgi:hypothetical protein
MDYVQEFAQLNGSLQHHIMQVVSICHQSGWSRGSLRVLIDDSVAVEPVDDYITNAEERYALFVELLSKRKLDYSYV